jgi:hypothetical protein
MQRYSSITTNQNHAGDTAYDTQLTLKSDRTGKDEVVTDPRTIAITVLPTSLPGRFIDNSEDLQEALLDNCYYGGTPTPDRALPIRFTDPKTGVTHEYPSIHGIARARITMSYDDFEKALETNAVGKEARRFVRIEDTSRSETPDQLGANIQSNALQNLLTLVSNLATAQGKDAVDYLAENGVIGNSENQKESVNTNVIWHEKKQALVGNYNNEKLDEVDKMIDLAESEIDRIAQEHGETVSSEWQMIFSTSRIAIGNIRKQERIQMINEKHPDGLARRKASSKLDYYLGKHRSGKYQHEKSLGNYGLLMKLLSDDDLRDLLENRYGVTEDPIDYRSLTELTRGRLQFLFADQFTRESVLHDEQFAD